MIIHNVEQNSNEWYELRAGIPTASNFNQLITGTGKPSTSIDKYAEKLAGDFFAGAPIDAWEGNKYTDRGHEIEPDARNWYEMRTDSEVQQVGFITDDDKSTGCSPDGLISDNGLIEIKCLPKQHIKALLYFNKYKKAPPDYRPQIQGQMMITGREWCDLVYYHPELPKIIIREYADLDYQIILTEQITKVITLRDDIVNVLKNI